MALDVGGKVVVITGASRGLGRGMAERMAARGVRLGLCARQRPELGLPAGQAHCASVDVTDAAALDCFADAVCDRLGPIDLWINNAGVLEPIAFVRDLPPAAFGKTLDVNVLGVLHGIQAYLRSQRKQDRRGGVVVNISSGAALKGYAGWGAYCASKAAVDRLTECLQLEEAGQGLRAYSVAPGVIDTAMQELIRAQTPDRFPEVERFRQLKQANAFNSPAYVADELLALAFDPAVRPERVVVRILPERGSS
ncbi:MAG: SDR family oxidoreductase [Planctomycetota bacterium]|nr:MAG: SDR family oxidoreductase [Planctomycetota bacterium]